MDNVKEITEPIINPTKEQLSAFYNKWNGHDWKYTARQYEENGNHCLGLTVEPIIREKK